MIHKLLVGMLSLLEASEGSRVTHNGQQTRQKLKSPEFNNKSVDPGLWWSCLGWTRCLHRGRDLELFRIDPG